MIPNVDEKGLCVECGKEARVYGYDIDMFVCGSCWIKLEDDIILNKSRSKVEERVDEAWERNR